MTAILDYGIGNIHSVHKALESLGAETVVTARPEELVQARKIVLPGVGAFDDAMGFLNRDGLAEVLKEQARQGKIILGICLGMQLLFEQSEESLGNEKGLCLIGGRVVRFSGKMKVPHMGWNRVRVSDHGSACRLLSGLGDNAYVYFCHSYYALPSDQGASAGLSDYQLDFTSVAWKDNIYGVQFHPEKSQETGLRILKNFVAL